MIVWTEPSQELTISHPVEIYIIHTNQLYYVTASSPLVDPAKAAESTTCYNKETDESSDGYY